MFIVIMSCAGAVHPHICGWMYAHHCSSTLCIYATECGTLARTVSPALRPGYWTVVLGGVYRDHWAPWPGRDFFNNSGWVVTICWLDNVSPATECRNVVKPLSFSGRLHCLSQTSPNTLQANQPCVLDTDNEEMIIKRSGEAKWYFLEKSLDVTLLH